MFILEEPYVSDLLVTTIADLGAPVLDTPMARRALAGAGVPLLDDHAFADAYRSTPHARLYSNSENAIGWISEHLADTDLPRLIDLFKDKVRFRRLVADLYPDYGFAEVASAEIAAFDPASLRTPFVIKPAVGFFSMGVHVVDTLESWPGVLAAIQREVAASGNIYPDSVLGLARFIAEEVIEGDEYAVDAYFDSDGAVTIVNVYAHLFSSAHDVSDRVYYTTADLVTSVREPFERFLGDVGRRAGLVDFPMHAELRVDEQGRIAPIEINPMRFGGWCSTDLAHFAHGVNPYTAYLQGAVPDWARIGRERAGTLTAIVIADLPSSVELGRIESVDYEAFAANFSNVLELRRTDFGRYPVFAFTFVEVPDNDLSELHAMLGADLTPYLKMRPRA